MSIYYNPQQQQSVSEDANTCWNVLLWKANEENHTTVLFSLVFSPEATEHSVVAELDLLSGNNKQFTRRKTCLTNLLRQHVGG